MFDSLFNFFGQCFFPFILLALFFVVCMKIYENRRRSLHRVGYELAGKYVLITGASSGVGRALAEEFCAHGAKVILASRDMEKLRTLKQMLMTTCKSPSNTPETCYLDLSNPAGMEDCVEDILKMSGGRLDILVNNAGVSVRSSCERTTVDVHRRLMEVNYFGHVQLTQLLLDTMKKTAEKYGPTCIVCISSIQGRIAIPYRSAYAASKHAFQAYFDSLRAELSIVERIRVLVVSPGYISTNLSQNALTGDGEKYGKMDETTKKGMQPELAAKHIVESVLDGREELILAPIDNKAAVAIRAVLPNLYFWIMAKRAAKEQKAN